MNREPIQFLPVAPWPKARPAKLIERAFCYGVAVGSGVTMLVAWLLIHFFK